jgi:hypothetical protein
VAGFYELQPLTRINMLGGPPQSLVMPVGVLAIIMPGVDSGCRGNKAAGVNRR